MIENYLKYFKVYKILNFEFICKKIRFVIKNFFINYFSEFFGEVICLNLIFKI